MTINSPADARALGIETVYQDLALFDNLGPTANFYAGREHAGPALAAALAPRAQAPARWPRRRATCSTGCRCTARRPRRGRADVGRPAAGHRRRRAAAFASRVVILDEPTAALGLRESRRVLDLILRCATRGRR